MLLYTPNMDTPPPLPATDEPRWPMKTILFIGYFGKNTPEGRRYHNRCMGALLLLLCGSILWIPVAFRLHGGTEDSIDRIGRIFEHLLAGVAFSFIAWSFWKYLQEIDELARGLQLQAIALTYLTGLSGMAFVGLLGIVEHWNIDPFIAYILLEPVRGFWLWRLARRY